MRAFVWGLFVVAIYKLVLYVFNLNIETEVDMFLTISAFTCGAISMFLKTINITHQINDKS
ncbi:hypothetical protein [Staphylococcus sp. GDY8P131P]|uniref:hypothetical protein n=1 Tax=Staphylococcus TaxID=1279 RepID=UPI001AEBC232|nr:hypothetical protein [Staphylococcus sp. GDY8P131P]